MAITNLTNTRWRFNSTPIFDVIDEAQGTVSYYAKYFLNFNTIGTDTSTNWIQLHIQRVSSGNHSIYYRYQQYSGVNAYSENNDSWRRNFFREILITGGNDVQNSDLIAWLESTATLIDRYYVDKADLVSVADAIRTKGGTSAPLEFPSGFVTAINDITTPIPSNYGLITYNGSILTVS